MRDYADDYLRGPGRPMGNSLRMALKLLTFGLVSAAVTDLLKTHTPVQGRIADLAGLLTGALVQQAIPPRLSISKLVLTCVSVCAVMGLLFLLHI